jgi:RHS repeat-associated protein
MSRLVNLFALLSMLAAPAWAGVTVTLTAPANGTVYPEEPADVVLWATTTVSQGYSVSKVEFFSGTTLIGTSTVPNPGSLYIAFWNGVPPGNYVLTAKATAVKNNSPDQTATSSPVNITVNARPVLTFTSPVYGTTYNIPPPPITVSATASDSDGTITKVEFWDQGCGGTPSGLLATLTAPPYSFVWTIPPPYQSGGKPTSYCILALATDNRGAQGGDWMDVYLEPTIAISSPANGANYAAPATIALNVSFSPPDYPIGKIQFYNGTTLIGEAFTAPYSFSWQNVGVGTYSLTAKMLSSLLEYEWISAPVNVTVTAAQGALYFIHPDHLNTPRLVVDATGTTVWRWDQAEPFGVNVPDENPSGLGSFDLPLRLPGQYFDKETNQAQNWVRDYDSATGRYIQSDPLGLQAGLNTYAYVGSSPPRYTDPTGLETYQCRRPLGGLPGDNQRSGPDIPGNPFYHQYSCTRDASGKLVCGGQGFTDSWWGSPGKPTTPETDYYSASACKKTQDDNSCFEKCLIKEWAKKRPRYGVPFGMNCQEYDENVNNICRKECGLK